MTRRTFRVATATLSLIAAGELRAQAEMAPEARVYKHTPQGELKLHLFVPPDSLRAPSRGAVIVLHGSGWHSGQAEWTFGTARRYASLGLVAASVQYRLSDEKNVTPIDALEDVQDAVRWLRANAREIGISPNRIVAYGSSAGSHLAAVAALAPPAEDVASGAPNTVIANSLPADVTRDSWFVKILLGRAGAGRYSPMQLVRRGAPPFFIFMGSDDSLTPAAYARQFCDQLTAASARCELVSYPKLGHLLTRNLEPRAQETGPFDTDPEAAADARARIDRFLRDLGYIK